MPSPLPRLALGALLLLSACGGLSRRHPLDSAEILDRPAPAASVEVKHVLLSWKWLAPTYRRMGMAIDPRGEERTEGAAEELAKGLLGRLRAGEPIEPMMKELSEDGGSAATGASYPVSPDARFVPEFKDLALRLQPGESGIVRSTFGLHVMKRVK